MNPLDNSNETAERKLILLYLLEKLNIELSNLQIIKIALENSLMNYFFLQHYIDELVSMGMINIKIIENKKLYSITTKGKQSLSFFNNKIPISTRSRIDKAVYEIRKKIKNETLITADYITESENEFIVMLGIHEDGFPLMDLKLTVGTKKDAVNICDNWKNNSQFIYSQILDSFMSKP